MVENSVIEIVASIPQIFNHLNWNPFDQKFLETSPKIKLIWANLWLGWIPKIFYLRFSRLILPCLVGNPVNKKISEFSLLPTPYTCIIKLCLQGLQSDQGCFWHFLPGQSLMSVVSKLQCIWSHWQVRSRKLIPPHGSHSLQGDHWV